MFGALWPAAVYSIVIYVSHGNALQWSLLVGTTTPLAAWVATEHPDFNPADRPIIWWTAGAVMAVVAVALTYGLMTR